MKERKEKIENLILHFSKAGMFYLGKKKLVKLMYFVDFTYFEIFNDSVTGLKYEKRQFGPMPEAKVFYSYLSNLKDKGLIEIGPSNKNQIPENISAKSKPDYSVFSKEEVRVIKEITEKFRYHSAKEVEQIAKDEPPYKMVKAGEKIPYHLAFYRNSFDEITLNDENTS